MEVVGRAGNGDDAVLLTKTLRPDVVLMDIRMPGLDGIEATAAIRANHDLASSRILVLTTFHADDLVFAALRAGASGFLLKDTPVPRLIDAIRVVASGEALLDPAVTRSFIEQMVVKKLGQVATPPLVEPLTAREQDIWLLVARGYSNGEIAEQLVISPGTVKTHVHHLLAKLDLRDRSQLVIAAYESGAVLPGTHPSSDVAPK